MTSLCFGLDDVEDRDYDYRNSGYQPDITAKGDGLLSARQIEERVSRDSLNGRIQLIAQNFKTATYNIDQCIQATVPSDSFRTIAVNRWEENRSSHKTRGWTAVAITVLSIASLLTPAPLLALVSVVSTIYAALQFRRAGQASDQIEGWKADPAVRLAMERKTAYEKGFAYVYQNDLKLDTASHHAVLLRHEVSYLFDRYFDRTCTDLSAQRCINDQQKKDWLDRFRTNNPISKNVLLYVYERVPDEYAAITRNFESIAASLKDIETDFANLRADRKAETAQIINEIESQRTIACAIPNAALQYKLHEARDERDRRLREGGGLGRLQIENEYQAEKNKYLAIYAAAILPITIYFDGKVREARDALKAVLRTISQQEANAFSPYYEYSQGIVAATASVKQKGAAYSQPAFNPNQYFQIPTLPKIEINFIYQAPPEVDRTFWEH